MELPTDILVSHIFPHTDIDLIRKLKAYRIFPKLHEIISPEFYDEKRALILLSNSLGIPKHKLKEHNLNWVELVQFCISNSHLHILDCIESKYLDFYAWCLENISINACLITFMHYLRVNKDKVRYFYISQHSRLMSHPQFQSLLKYNDKKSITVKCITLSIFDFLLNKRGYLICFLQYLFQEGYIQIEGCDDLSPDVIVILKQYRLDISKFYVKDILHYVVHEKEIFKGIEIFLQFVSCDEFYDYILTNSVPINVAIHYSKTAQRRDLIEITEELQYNIKKGTEDINKRVEDGRNELSEYDRFVNTFVSIELSLSNIPFITDVYILQFLIERGFKLTQLKDETLVFNLMCGLGTDVCFFDFFPEDHLIEMKILRRFGENLSSEDIVAFGFHTFALKRILGINSESVEDMLEELMYVDGCESIKEALTAKLLS